jgi:dihydrodipicolinate synthase/N-acetylneuraminate lyase
MMLSSLAIGADGAIGTSYNIVPKLAVKVYDCFMSGDMKTALVYQNKLNAFIKVVLEFAGNRGYGYWKACLT